jgi:putative DNA primase/helicase
MVEMAKSEEQLVARAADFDHDGMLLNVTNGTIDLRTGTLHQHRREDLITKMAPVQFDPAAKCPRFLQHLTTIFGGDMELVGYAQRVFGYAMTGDVSEKSLFVLHGDGDNCFRQL